MQRSHITTTETTGIYSDAYYKKSISESENVEDSN